MSMAYRDAINYLRPVADSTPLAGYGAALTKAIEALEKVERMEAELRDERDRFDKYADYSVERDKMIERLKEDLRSATDRCKFCVQMTKPLLCLGSDYLCHECNQHDCVCQDCKDGSKWEWRGGNEA